MENSSYDIIIVGGGVSGLSLAYFLAEMDRKVLVLEQSKRVGGAVESLIFEDFSIDLGAHTAYNSYTTLLELAGDNSSVQQLQKRRKVKYFFIGKNGFQKLTKFLNFGELLLNIPKVFFTKKEGKNVKEYFATILGKRNYKKFARHFFKAVLCQEAENYPALFFLKKRNSRNKDFPKSFTFPQGIQTFTDALSKNPNIEILCNSSIEHIEKEGNFFQIVNSKKRYQAKDIAFANYASEAGNLIRDIAPEMAKELAKIEYKTVSSLGIIVEKKSVEHLQEFAGLLTPTDDFTSIVSRDVALHKKFRGFTIHAQGKVSENELLQRICTALHIEKTTPITQHYKNSFLPKLVKGHEDFLESLTETIEQTPNVFITGNYFQGLSLEDCMLRSKSEALRYISAP